MLNKSGNSRGDGTCSPGAWTLARPSAVGTEEMLETSDEAKVSGGEAVTEEVSDAAGAGTFLELVRLGMGVQPVWARSVQASFALTRHGGYSNTSWNSWHKSLEPSNRGAVRELEAGAGAGSGSWIGELEAGVQPVLVRCAKTSFALKRIGGNSRTSWHSKDKSHEPANSGAVKS
jgi:hypothetical protein